MNINVFAVRKRNKEIFAAVGVRLERIFRLKAFMRLENFMADFSVKRRESSDLFLGFIAVRFLQIYDGNNFIYCHGYSPEGLRDCPDSQLLALAIC